LSIKERNFISDSLKVLFSPLRLSKLNGNLLSSLNQLQALLLSNNAITFIPPRLFSNLASLTHLLLDYNLIEELPLALFNKSSNRVTVLDLSHNKLKTISTFVEPLVQLQSLSVSYNLIDDLARMELPTLWRLQANGNLLSQINAGHLRGLPALQVLDLSSNSISSVERVRKFSIFYYQIHFGF
jgi:Leucine-rich repeat (LRR) protein